MSFALTLTAILVALAVIWYWLNTGELPDIHLTNKQVLIEPQELASIILKEVIDHPKNSSNIGPSNSTNGDDLPMLSSTRIFDGSMSSERDFLNKTIPFAEFMDLRNTLRDPLGTYPNTFPPVYVVKNRMEELGVGINDTIIGYNQRGKIGSGRVFHILTAYGFQNVKVLNGDLGYWEDIGLPVLPGRIKANKSSVLPPLKLARSSLSLLKEVFSVSIGHIKTSQLLDVRPEAFFNGSKTDLALQCRPGHIGEAKNIPLRGFVDINGRYRNAAELILLLDRQKVDLNKKIIISGLTGIQASEAYLALFNLFQLKKEFKGVDDEQLAVYDGSWSEFGCTVKEQWGESGEPIPYH